MKNSKKNTILVIMRGYLPGKRYGGPVTCIENLANNIGEKYNIKVICNNHDLGEKEKYKNIQDGWNKVKNVDVYYIDEQQYNTKEFEKIISPFKDNIALFYLSGVYYVRINYRVMKLSKKLHIPIVIAPMGDLMKNTIAMKSKAKKIKKLIFLKLCKIFKFYKDVYFQATSNEEHEGLHKYLGVKENKIFQIPHFPTEKIDRNEYIKEQNKLKILFCSRIMVKKNLLYALDVVKNISDKFSIEFDLFGPIEDEDYWKKCEAKIEQINKNNQTIKIEYKGNLSQDEAKRIYKNYDCFLLPTISENYGYVIVESMFSDCIVVISKGTTPWDDCDNNGGYAIPLDKPNEFTKTLENLASMSNEEYQKLVDQNREYINNKIDIKNILKEHEKMIENIKYKNEQEKRK